MKAWVTVLYAVVGITLLWLALVAELSAAGPVRHCDALGCIEIRDAPQPVALVWPKPDGIHAERYLWSPLGRSWPEGHPLPLPEFLALTARLGLYRQCSSPDWCFVQDKLGREPPIAFDLEYALE